MRCVDDILNCCPFFSKLVLCQETYLPQRYEHWFVVPLMFKCKETTWKLVECKTKNTDHTRTGFRGFLKLPKLNAKLVIFSKHIPFKGELLLPLVDTPKKGQDPRKVKYLWISAFFPGHKPGQKASQCNVLRCERKSIPLPGNSFPLALNAACEDVGGGVGWGGVLIYNSRAQAQEPGNHVLISTRPQTTSRTLAELLKCSGPPVLDGEARTAL